MHENQLEYPVFLVLALFTQSLPIVNCQSKIVHRSLDQFFVRFVLIRILRLDSSRWAVTSSDCHLVESQTPMTTNVIIFQALILMMNRLSRFAMDECADVERESAFINQNFYHIPF